MPTRPFPNQRMQSYLRPDWPSAVPPPDQWCTNSLLLSRHSSPQSGRNSKQVCFWMQFRATDDDNTLFLVCFCKKTITSLERWHLENKSSKNAWSVAFLEWHFSFSLFLMPKTWKNNSIRGSSRIGRILSADCRSAPPQHAPGARMTWVLTNSLK